MSIFKNNKAQQIEYGKGFAKVPVILQLEMLECGAACLTMILAYYGRYITLEEARELCGVSRDGQSAASLLKAARVNGMEAKGFSMGVGAFNDFNEFPCIVHWNMNHFVVLTGMKGNKVYITDPGNGPRVISLDEFSKNFTGIVITLKPGEKFEKQGKPKSIYGYARKQLVGTSAIVAFVLLTAVITNIMGVINPIFSKVFLDRLITGRNPQWEGAFIFLLILVSAISIISSMINSICSLRINGKMAVVGSSSFMWKTLRLPMRFYSQRIVGDIQSRQNSAASISTTLINTFAPLLLNSVMMIFYLVVMINQSLFLSAFGIISMLFNLFISRYVSKRRINITRASTRDSGKLFATTTSGIEMIETIKASGVETGFFEKWAGYQSLVNTNNIKILKLNRDYGLIPTILTTLSSDLVLILGIYLVIRGQFTCGSVMAFQGLIASFMAPAMTLTKANQTIMEMRTNMERLEDVMEYPDDDAFSDEICAEGNIKLGGEIEFKNVTFGYAPLAKPLLDDFSIRIKPGSKVAFVGKSGCGKSTIVKLLSGLYQPWSGEILFDGKSLKSINRNVFKSSLAVVDQDIILFNDTIKENIRLWDKSIEDFDIILAARDAQLYEDIIKRQHGFDSMLDENGNNMSGGQKQRLEIARTLALDPTIVVMDEATSALDAITELNVVNSIAERGITCIVVAHRLSTIRDCDDIVVIDEGKIVEHGTHLELMQKGGLYTELVSNE